MTSCVRLLPSVVVASSGAGEGDLEISIESEEGGRLENVVRQTKADQFSVEFKPTRVGLHKASVRFNELHVPGRPHKVIHFL